MQKKGINCDYRLFNFVAKEGNEISGILKGHSCYEEVFIDDLIVIEKYRGKGVGTKLLKQVEDYHRNKGFRNINLCTYEFQAPEFYKKFGFKIEFIRKNEEEPKLTRYFFNKIL